MSSTHAPNSKKSWVTRASIGGASAFAIAIAGFGLTANAAGTSFTLYDEGDSPNPYSVTEGLVFYKAADMGWVVNVPISSITSLGYTVADGSSFAPSFQLVTYADRPGKNSPFTPVTHAYTRLVWEPYMQSPAQSANTGTYTNLQDGAWWTNQIISGPGSQSQPMPLNFFKTGGAAGWTNVSVTAIDVHQGSTSDTTSVVTHVTYNGTEVALGNADVTPFNQAAIDAATAPLNAQISSLNGQISTLTAANASFTAQVSTLQGQLANAFAAVNTAQGQLTTAQGQFATTAALLLTTQNLLAAAQGQVGADQDMIDALLAQVADLQSQVDALSDEVENLQGQLADAQSDVTDLQGQLADAQQALADANESHAAETADLNDQIDTLSGQLSDLQDHADDLQGQLDEAVQALVDADAAHAAEKASLEDSIDELTGQLDAANDHADDLQGDLDDAVQALADAVAAHATETAGLNTQITGLNTQITGLTTDKANLLTAFTAYQATHHTADGTNLGVSVAVLTTTPVHNKTVGVRLVGSIATASGLKYQWYVANKAVAGATGATFKVPSSATGKTVFVLVTGTSKFMVYSIESNYGVAK